jgi:hypothetical protein
MIVCNSEVIPRSTLLYMYAADKRFYPLLRRYDLLCSLYEQRVYIFIFMG